MLSFNSFLSESLAPASLPKAAFIISKYLKKKTGFVFFTAGDAVEAFQNSKGKGFGIRMYCVKKSQSIRFNWRVAASVGLTNLESITYWNGKDDKPYVITYKAPVSLVKVLPMIADIVSAGKAGTGKVWTLPDDIPLNESYSDIFDVISEAAANRFSMPEIIDGVVEMIQAKNFAKGKVYAMYKGAGYKVFDQLEKMYPNLITVNGTRYAWTGTPKDVKKILANKDAILKAIGAVEGEVSRGSSKESYEYDSEIKNMESNMERLSFEEQLKDLENLLRLTISGASNSLFVAGKGGVGKTYTAEKILGQMGLEDGKGYFKNTGSASAAGIYSLLFKYSDKVILFDDSDGALGDQDARNIIKAATDDKPIRKLVWNKMGKNIADPDEMTPDEILDAGLIPRFFNFTGKIIFISNLPLNKLDPDGALRTRAFIINIDPTEMEIYDFMDKIVGKMPVNEGLELDELARKEVVKILRTTTSKEAPSLRKLSRGLNVAAGAKKAGVVASGDQLKALIQRYA